MTDPLQTAQDAAHHAIARLADAGHRMANEHAFAVDLLRAQVESLRAINANLRERIEVLDHRCAHTAEVLAMPVDTEAPREVLWGDWKGLPHMVEPGYRTGADMPVCREAVCYEYGWSLVDSLGRTRARHASESQAIRWVLDGVLP
jgi:hypothetical protein